jgi:hypothetical protein
VNRSETYSCKPPEVCMYVLHTAYLGQPRASILGHDMFQHKQSVLPVTASPFRGDRASDLANRIACCGEVETGQEKVLVL